MKKATALILAAALVFSLRGAAFAAKKPGGETVYSSYVIPYGAARMIAHRGYSAVAPENTLPAFRLAGEYGFPMAECDVSPTSDGVWVIMHDDTVDRMTDGKGRVTDLTFDQIRALRVDSGNNIGSYPGTRVPTLTEYLDVCAEYGMRPVIEIKKGARVSDMESLAELLYSRRGWEDFILISFERDLLVRIKRIMPVNRAYLLVGAAGGAADVEFCVKNGLDGVDFSKKADVGIIDAARAAGLETLAWTVDDVKTAEKYYRLGVRSFTTNALTPMRAQDGDGFARVLWRLRDDCYAVRRLFGGER